MIDTRTAPYAATVLRVSLGAMYVAHSLIRSRWVALALIPVLAGATWVHSGNGWVFTAPNGGWEYSVFLIAMSLVLALLGDGRYALVNRLEHRKLKVIPA